MKSESNPPSSQESRQDDDRLPSAIREQDDQKSDSGRGRLIIGIEINRAMHGDARGITPSAGATCCTYLVESFELAVSPVSPR